MLYTEYPPSPALSRYLECLWFVYDEGRSHHAPATEKILPDGCIEWIFHLGSSYQIKLTTGLWDLQPRSFVIGEMTRFLVLQPAGRVQTMGVRFKPGGAYRFLPLPVNLLTNKIVQTIDIWGQEGREIEDSVFSAGSKRERQKLLEDFLLRRLRHTEPKPRFEAAVAKIMRSLGQTRVGRLADEVNLSKRQLEREFRAGAGLSPKSLARVIRFQNLLRLVGEDALREWASIAFAVGYADQPHMVREFREFTGQTPTEGDMDTLGDLARNFVSPKRLATLLGIPGAG